MSYETLDNNRMHCIDSLRISDAVIFYHFSVGIYLSGRKKNNIRK